MHSAIQKNVFIEESGLRQSPSSSLQSVQRFFRQQKEQCVSSLPGRSHGEQAPWH